MTSPTDPTCFRVIGHPGVRESDVGARQKKYRVGTRGSAHPCSSCLVLEPGSSGGELGRVDRSSLPADLEIADRAYSRDPLKGRVALPQTSNRSVIRSRIALRTCCRHRVSSPRVMESSWVAMAFARAAEPARINGARGTRKGRCFAIQNAVEVTISKWSSTVGVAMQGSSPRSAFRCSGVIGGLGFRSVSSLLEGEYLGRWSSTRGFDPRHPTEAPASESRHLSWSPPCHVPVLVRSSPR